MTGADIADAPPAARPSAPRALRPKDAATLVIVDERGRAPRILMGKRRADLVFMPGKYVFPGGRVDRADRIQSSADALVPDVEKLLLQHMKGRPSTARARGLALAAIREAYEETGIVVGRRTAPASGAARASAVTTAAPDHRDRAAATWAAFLATGHEPALAPLSLLARAITPPGRARRYDTRFFLAEASSIAAITAHRDEELSHIDWFTLEDVRALDLPVITRAIVEDLGVRLAGQRAAEAGQAMPFYFFQGGAFRRQMLARDGIQGAPIIWRR